MDPELAMALRVSMEEERARQEAASKTTAEQEGTAAEGGAAAAVAGGEGGEGATAVAAATAAATAEESKGAEGGDAAGTAPAATAERDAMQVFRFALLCACGLVMVVVEASLLAPVLARNLVRHRRVSALSCDCDTTVCSFLPRGKYACF